MDFDARADPIAVGFGSLQLEPQGTVSLDIVAVEISRAVVAGDEYVEIAVIVEIAVGGAPADFGLIESTANGGSDVFKASGGVLQE